MDDKENSLFYLCSANTVNSVKNKQRQNRSYIWILVFCVGDECCSSPSVRQTSVPGKNACSWHPIFCMRLRTTLNRLFSFIFDFRRQIFFFLLCLFKYKKGKKTKKTKQKRNLSFCKSKPSHSREFFSLSTRVLLTVHNRMQLLFICVLVFSCIYCQAVFGGVEAGVGRYSL